ncbi:MAG: helix-hairpin-helix domain-containing protein [Ferruginibacter sp.]
MRKILLLFACFTFHHLLSAQVVTELPVIPEQQLENITENTEDAEIEDDSYLQEMVYFLKNPVNLNTVDQSILKDIKILSPIQIQNLISYRSILGKLVSIYELQAVPGWDVQTIRKLRPYITVGNEINLVEDIGERLRGGEHSILLRGTQVLERSKGYKLDSSSATNFYPGSPQRIFVRYKYLYKNLLQYGIVAEKDPGEQFFKGKQNAGFDFYSAHIFVRNLGIIRSLALGDFTVNMGQGLTQWQSLAFKKGPDITATKRQSSVLKPYNSSGEINFHRGAGITIGKNNWEATVFGSYKKLDANFIASDSLNNEDIISSLQTSGYHRTKSESEDKNIQRQIAFGGNIAFRLKRLHIGANAIQYQFKYPLQKDAQAYNAFALSGKSFGNYSMDYSYTLRNMHLFGELATTDKKALAFVNGLLISISSRVDMSFLYRNISKKYQSLYTNAFTESTYPTNERGFFSGISIRPNSQWQVDAYADIYKFPWLKYGVNAPTSGSDYFIQLLYKPNRQLEVYTRYKRESKGLNLTGDFVLYPVLSPPKRNWRVQYSYKISPQITFRNRVEMVWFSKKDGPDFQQGFLIYADVIYKPTLKPFSANIRLQYFQTDGYNSRLYAYESDVLYSYSIPVFYLKGYRYYLNVNYDVNRKLSIWAKIAQTLNPDRDVVGSGLDEITGKHKTEVKLQLIYKF